MAIAPGEKEEMRTLAREVGRRSVGQLEASLARIMGDMGTNNRWMLGALVLLNGGGIVLVAGQHAGLAAQVLESAISFFVIGAALAVVAMIGSALSALILSRQIAEASALWTQVSTSGEMNEDALKAAGKVRRTGLFSALVTLALGLLSLILFVAGVMTLGSGLTQFIPSPAQPIANPPAPANAAAAPAPHPVTGPAPVETPKPEPEKAAPAPKATPAAKPVEKPRRRATPAAQPASSEAPAATPPAAN